MVEIKYDAKTRTEIIVERERSPAEQALEDESTAALAALDEELSEQ